MIHLLSCLSAENADILHLPHDGGVMDQPYLTYECLLIVRDEKIKLLSEQAEERQRKMAASKPRAARRGRR